MGLYGRLLEEDKEQLWKYLNWYSEGGSKTIPKDKLDFFLRYWNNSKNTFFKAFNEEFIIKKEIRITKQNDELADEMYYAFNNNRLVRNFIYNYRTTVGNIDNYDLCHKLRLFVDDYDMLVSNVYKRDSFTIPAELTKDKRPLVVNSNCKAVKMFGKIVEALGLTYPVSGEEYDVDSGYEMFRQVHSQVLNQKQIKGNLCLSIHPLDYLTMSDNESGWSSCMSWMEEVGDYRLGTIEMMNSPYIIVAYIESKNNMDICGREWNNKRWRQLYVVTKEVILGNRQYPYHSEEIQGTAIKWIRELMNQVPGYGPYPETTINLKNHESNIIGNKTIDFEFYFDYMYNDIYDYRLAYVADQKFEDGDRYEINLSGPAVCTGCGDIIPYNTVEPNSVQCRECDGHWRCDFCGDWHSAHDEYYSVNDGYIACTWCYENELTECQDCGDMVRNDDIAEVYIQFVDTENEILKEKFNYNYKIILCGDCLSYCRTHESEIYGKLYDVVDPWGFYHKAFDIRNIDDEVLEKCVPWYAVSTVKLMRDANSDEERLRLLEKIGF